MKHDYKALMKELKRKDITVKRAEQIEKIIFKRVEEIWDFIFSRIDGLSTWFSFDNDYGCAFNHVLSNGGFFDPDRYKNFIYLVGEWSPEVSFLFNDEFYSFFEDDQKNFKQHIDFDQDIGGGIQYGGFPTKLLYDKNWKKTVLQEIEEKENNISDKIVKNIHTLNDSQIKQIYEKFFKDL